MRIGKEARKARESLGLTQAEYGDLVGLTQQRVSEIENGASVGIKTLERLIGRGGFRWTEKGPRAA